MAKYTEEYAKRVLDKVDIVALINQFTALTNNENVFVGKCPFHKDKDESLVVDKEKKSFHCFSCGKGGNAIVFLMEIKNISFDQAIEMLSKYAKIVPTESDIVKKSIEVHKSNLRDIHRDAAQFYHKKLESQDGQAALQYLKDRKLNDSTIKTFNLGYAPGDGNALYKYLLSKGYDLQLMIDAGLVRVSANGPYDMFRNRVMFPIMDENKRVIAFGGRVLTDDAKPKYLNSPESPIFNKSTTLYGIHDTQGLKSNYFILVEGNMDVIQLHQAGLRNSVATLGTAFTAAHVPVIKAHVNNLVLSYDDDAAGKKAALKTIDIAQEANMPIRVLSMSPCKDPDDFIKQFGVKEYRERINGSVNSTNFRLRCLADEYDLKDPAQKHEYLKNAVSMIIGGQDRDKVREERDR